MSGLDIFAWIVLVVLVVTAIGVFVTLAMLPGKIAAQRQHPYDEAINVAGWLGAFLGGVFWPVALIWAFTHKSVESDGGLAEPVDEEAQS